MLQSPKLTEDDLYRVLGKKEFLSTVMIDSLQAEIAALQAEIKDLKERLELGDSKEKMKAV